MNIQKLYLVFFSFILLTAGLLAKSFSGATTLNDRTFKERVSVSGAFSARHSSFKEELVVSGSTSLHESQVNFLKCSGSLAAEQTRIGSACIRGGVSLNKVIIDDALQMTGGLRLIDSNVPTLTMTGGLHAKNSVMNTVTITAQDVLLDESQVKNNIVIKVSKPGSFWSWLGLSWTTNKGIPEIKLRNSTINGTIIFSDASGIVHLYGKYNHINKVENGTIVMHDASEFID